MYFEIQHIIFITYISVTSCVLASQLLTSFELYKFIAACWYCFCCGHHRHHQAIRMLSQHRNNQKLNGIGLTIIIRLLECSFITEGNMNWMELNLPSASHHHHQAVRMLNQQRNKQDHHHRLCVYMSHVRVQLIMSYWNHTEGCSIFAEISPNVPIGLRVQLRYNTEAVTVWH
jgi:hypothetical protein